MSTQDKPVFSQSNPPKEGSYSLIKRWIKFSLIATINVLVLAFFSAYFNNQPLSLLDVVGIVADSTGIVTGLLGIWFFFLSESLNRTTALNLDRTTQTVEELRNQMWAMVQQTFSTFVEREKVENVEEAKQALQEVKNQLLDRELPPQINGALETLYQRIETLEQSIKMRTPFPSFSGRQLSYTEANILELLRQGALSASDIHLRLRQKGAESGGVEELRILERLVNEGVLVKQGSEYLLVAVPSIERNH